MSHFIFDRFIAATYTLESHSHPFIGIPYHLLAYLILYSIQAMWSGCGIRMRKASLCRNHQSPSDIVTDRFRSQVLRYTVVLFQVGKSLKVLIVSSLRSKTHKTSRSSALDPIPCCTTLCYQPELQYHLRSPNEQPSTSDHYWCYHLGF